MAISFEQGHLVLGRLRGAPVRVHWSAPIGAFVLGRLRYVPWFWLAFLVLVMVHELGHALMVRGARAASARSTAPSLPRGKTPAVSSRTRSAATLSWASASKASASATSAGGARGSAKAAAMRRAIA